jgi:hypothetical protein
MLNCVAKRARIVALEKVDMLEYIVMKVVDEGRSRSEIFGWDQVDKVGNTGELRMQKMVGRPKSVEWSEGCC